LNNDISHILKDWSYDPSNVTARYVVDADGNKKIQLRVDLGLFQMEIKGRPDGSRPRGYDSALDYFRTLEKTSREPLRLTGDQCSELQQEAVQFYYRYLASFALEDYDAVINDTRHNLELFDFVSRYAESEDLAWEFLQFKPYVCMMSARAMAEKESAINNYEAALGAVQQALDQIKTFWEEQGEMELRDESYEVEVLNDLMSKLRDRKPRTEEDKIRAELEYAVSVENFEKAASLRDQLSKMK